MRILLDGRPLPRLRPVGTLDASWRHLVPALLEQKRASDQFTILSASLDPQKAKRMATYAKNGAAIAHQWSSPQFLADLGRFRLSTESLVGPQDLLHLSHPSWLLPTRAKIVVSAQSLLFRHRPQLLHPKQVHRLDKSAVVMASQASYWICPSQFIQKSLCQHFEVPKGRTTVIRPGVTDHFRAQVKSAKNIPPKDSTPYFLFLGSIEPRRNLKCLLQAFFLASQEGLKAKLIVAGVDGWKARSIQELPEIPTKVRDSIQFTGFVPEKDLPTLFAHALAFVHPSRYEAAGSTVIQAMAAGLPILCSNRGALPEVVQEAGLTFHPDDPEALSGYLLRLEADSAYRTQLAKQALDQSKTFTWRDAAKKTLDAYQTTLALPS